MALSIGIASTAAASSPRLNVEGNVQSAVVPTPTDLPAAFLQLIFICHVCAAVVDAVVGKIDMDVNSGCDSDDDDDERRLHYLKASDIKNKNYIFLV
jgi:hypothetical protein